jgi:hypothetical protein
MSELDLVIEKIMKQFDEIDAQIAAINETLKEAAK